MMSIRPWFLALTTLFPVLLSNQQAVAQTVHYVDNLGDCEGLAPCYPAIMDAVTAAVPSDSIEVFPGVYHEAVVFEGAKDHITLQAHPHAQPAAGRGEALRPVIVAPNPTITLWTRGVQVRDFVIEGGSAAFGGRHLGRRPARQRDWKPRSHVLLRLHAFHGDGELDRWRGHPTRWLL
jgi:hypothetical protein